MKFQIIREYVQLYTHINVYMRKLYVRLLLKLECIQKLSNKTMCNQHLYKQKKIINKYVNEIKIKEIILFAATLLK